MARLNCNPSLHSPHCATYRTLQHRGGIFECCKLAISQRWYHRHLPKGCRCPGRVAEKRRPGTARHCILDCIHPSLLPARVSVRHDGMVPTAVLATAHPCPVAGAVDINGALTESRPRAGHAIDQRHNHDRAFIIRRLRGGSPPLAVRRD